MKRGRPKLPENEKAKPTDRIKCEVCGKEYFRSGKTAHIRGKIHQEYLKIHNSVQKVIKENKKGNNKKDENGTKILTPHELHLGIAKKSIVKKYNHMFDKKSLADIYREEDDLDELSDIENFESDEADSSLPGHLGTRKIESENKIKSKVYKYGDESNDDSRNEKKDDGFRRNLLTGSAEEIQERIRKLANF